VGVLSISSSLSGIQKPARRFVFLSLMRGAQTCGLLSRIRRRRSVAIPEIKLNYKIRYKITGFEKEFETAVYSETEVDAQKADIAGYEGVHSVYTIPVHADDEGEVVG
jgi:hypothetical protein